MTAATTPARGGRGARDRILQAATRLFYAQGVNATGIGELTEVAHVSRRTLYQHFDSKDALIAAYLRRLDQASPQAREQALARTELAPRDRVLALFDDHTIDEPDTFRGCPFTNVAAEIADPAHPARRLAAEHKRDFRDLLRDTLQEAGAAEPDALADQLALVFDGALARATLLGETAPLRHARSAVETLLAAAGVR